MVAKHMGREHCDARQAADSGNPNNTSNRTLDNEEKSPFQHWKEENEITKHNGAVGTTLEQQIALACSLWDAAVGQTSQRPSQTGEILEALQTTPVDDIVSWKGFHVGWFLNVFCKTPYMQMLLEFGCELWFVRKVCIIEIIRQAHCAVKNEDTVPILSGPFVNFVDTVVPGLGLEGNANEIVKTPTTFLSYTGGYTLLETLDILQQLDPNEIIWMDIFCVNQFAWTGKSRSPEMTQFKNSFLGDLEQQIQSIHNTALVLGDWKDVMATLGQIWVLWEMFCTAEAGSGLRVSLPPAQAHDFVQNCLESSNNFDDIMTSIASIDAKRAEAEDDEDRQGIFEQMQAVGLSKVNNMASGAVRGWLYQKGQEHLAEQRESNGSPSPVLLNNLGRLLSEQGKWEEAEPLFREALEKRQNFLGGDHPDTLTSLNNLAHLLQNKGELEEAEPLFREALEKKQNVLGHGHPSTIISINNLASVLEDQGRLKEAEALYREALQKKQKMLGNNDPSTIASLNNLASVLDGQGRLEEAKPLYQEALEKQRILLGNDHPSTLSSLNNLAELLRAQGMLEEAETLFCEALEKRQKVLGHDHPDSLSSLSNLAVLLRTRGKLEEAEPMFREALESRQKVLGRDHPDTLDSLNNLAGMLKDLDMLEEAEALYREALEKRQKILGRNHPDTLTPLGNLAGLLQAQGKLEEAEPLLRETLEIRQNVLGRDHPDTLISMNNLASVLRAQGELNEAEPLFREALEKKQKLFGRDHPSAIVSMCNLSLLLHEIGGAQNVEESKALLWECKNMSLDKLGADHPHTVAILNCWENTYG